MVPLLIAGAAGIVLGVSVVAVHERNEREAAAVRKWEKEQRKREAADWRCENEQWKRKKEKRKRKNEQRKREDEQMRFGQVLKLIEEELDQNCYALGSHLGEKNDQVLKLTHENERLRVDSTDE